MNLVSRRALARYGADELLSGKSARTLAKELVSVLSHSRRTDDFNLLIADINYELERRGKIADTTVRTATELSAKLKTEITALVKKSTSVERVNLNEEIDKSVIGGVRIETATRVWDRTLASQLQKLKEIF